MNKHLLQFIQTQTINNIFLLTPFASSSINETFKYQKIPINTMNTQINLRLSDSMLKTAKKYSKQQGFGNIQEFIKETLREKLYPDTSSKELALVKKLIQVSEAKQLYGTEDELMKKLG